MKKLVCLSLVLVVLLGCLTACNFTQNKTGPLAGEAQSESKVEKMLTALAQSNLSDAKALMHAETAEEADDGLNQISDFLAGREATSIEQKSIKVSTSSGTSGKTRQEQVAYQVTLNDGDVIYLNVVYRSDSDGDGFVSFQLVLGVV